MKDQQTTKSSIAKSEYYQLIGLLTLAQSWEKKVKEIEATMRTITGEKDKWGHCGDAIYSNYSIDELLEKLDLKVVRTSRMRAKFVPVTKK